MPAVVEQTQVAVAALAEVDVPAVQKDLEMLVAAEQDADVAVDLAEDEDECTAVWVGFQELVYEEEVE